MSERKYPYIGKSKSDGVLVVFYGAGFGRLFRVDGWAGSLRNNYDESGFTNVTREVLTDTYGEVHSAEHEEFVIELAKNAEFLLNPHQAEGRFFFVAQNLFGFGSHGFCSDGARQISIPLPLEYESSKGHDSASGWPNIGDQVDVNGARGVVVDINDANKIAMVKFDHRFTAPVNIDSIKVIPAIDDEEDEWPQVGDEVTWGEREIAGTLKCIDNGFAWILCPDGKHTQQGVKYLKPPKTPEEELRDEIAERIKFDIRCQTGDDARVFTAIANALMFKYNITKKQ